MKFFRTTENRLFEKLFIYVVVFLFYFSGEREREKGKKEEKEKKENVFGRNEILDLLRNNRRKRLRNFRALALTDSRTDSPHVFPCLMKEEISVLFDET